VKSVRMMIMVSPSAKEDNDTNKYDLTLNGVITI